MSLPSMVSITLLGAGALWMAYWLGRFDAARKEESSG